MRFFSKNVRAAGLFLPLVASCAHHPLEVREVGGGPLATMRPVEDIPSLHDAQFLPAAEAAGHMRPGEEVIGFVVGGEPMAIALRVLDDHEIVNGRAAAAPEAAFAATW